MHELKEELNHQKPEKKREAVKKVIAAMTVGKGKLSFFEATAVTHDAHSHDAQTSPPCSRTL